MKDYKVFTREEEERIAILLKDDKYDLFYRSKFNIDVFLSSLDSNMDVISVINRVIAVYDGYYNAFNKEISILNKYKELYINKGGVLNKKELKSIFNIDTSKRIDKESLLTQIDMYSKYMNARDIMIKHNIRLVMSIANNYSRRTGLEYDDLFSEGLNGLIDGVEKYDIDYKTKFSTYITYRIKAYILRFVANNKERLAMSSTLYYEIRKFKKRVEKLQEELGRTLSYEEIAERLGIEEVKAKFYLSFPNTVVSLNKTINDDEDSTLEDTLVSEDEVERVLVNINNEDLVERIFSYLSKREIKVLTLIYGFDGCGYTRTISEVARIMKTNTENVRKIYKRILDRVRYYINRDPGLRDVRLHGYKM